MGKAKCKGRCNGKCECRDKGSDKGMDKGSVIQEGKGTGTTKGREWMKEKERGQTEGYC